jgi:hypothetical protein
VLRWTFTTYVPFTLYVAISDVLDDFNHLTCHCRNINHGVTRLQRSKHIGTDAPKTVGPFHVRKVLQLVSTTPSLCHFVLTSLWEVLCFLNGQISSYDCTVKTSEPVSPFRFVLFCLKRSLQLRSSIGQAFQPKPHIWAR